MAFCKYSTEYIANNQTEVDNIFINDYLPSAPENCVKVYLYGLYLCGSSLKADNSLENFAKHLQLEEDEVVSCFMYWQEMGLVQVLSTTPVEIRYIPLKNIISGTKLYKPEKYEVFNRQAQELFEGERQITKNEYYEYYDFLERFHMQQEALLMIIKYCIDSKKANVGYNYILTVAKNWANEGILTAEQVEEKLCQFEETSKEISLVLSALGIKRNSFIEEKNLYKKWQEIGFNNDVIIFVAKSLRKKNRANFEKLDTLLMKYYSLNLFSIIEIENFETKKSELYSLARSVNSAIGVYYENLETVVENYIVPWKNLGFSDEAILEIATYCRKASIRTLEGLNDKIQKFFKLGIVSVESLHSYLEEIIQTDKEIQLIINKIGLERKVNYLDREFFKTWTNAWSMSKQLIEYASTLAQNKTQPMQYMNSILSNWHQKGIKTIEKAQKNSSQPKSSLASNKEELKGRTYKKEELDALIQSIDEVEI